MSKTAIVTDTNSGLSFQRARELGFHLIPMPFLVDGVCYYEGIDCTTELFFGKLRAGAEVSTSQPAPAALTGLWDTLLETHSHVLFFPMSSGLSGTCATAAALARAYDGRVLVVDNHRISVTLTESMLDARTLLDRGCAPERVKALLEEDSRQCGIYLAVNTLKYLKLSGRVTPAAAAMATVLGLKPVLQIQGERLDAYKKVRGMRNARQGMLEVIDGALKTRLTGKAVKLFVANSGAQEECGDWFRQVREAFPAYPVEMSTLPLSICCHVGEGALGIAYVEKTF